MASVSVYSPTETDRGHPDKLDLSGASKTDRASTEEVALYEPLDRGQICDAPIQASMIQKLDQKQVLWDPLYLLTFELQNLCFPPCGNLHASVHMLFLLLLNVMVELCS